MDVDINFFLFSRVWETLIEIKKMYSNSNPSEYFCNYDGIFLIFKQLWSILMTTLNFIPVDRAMREKSWQRCWSQNTWKRRARAENVWSTQLLTEKKSRKVALKFRHVHSIALLLMFVSRETMLCVRVDSLSKWVSISRFFTTSHTARLMMPKTTTKMKICVADQTRCCHYLFLVS